MEEVQVGKVYRHFKGNYYFIEDVALDSETNFFNICSQLGKEVKNDRY